METAAGNGYSSVPLDIGDIAATIALASDALVAAAEALAEAARAISYASSPLNESIIIATRNEVDTPSHLTESLRPKLPQVVTVPQSQRSESHLSLSQSDMSISSSEAESKPADLSQVAPISGPLPPDHENGENSAKTLARTQPELNNKCDPLPQVPNDNRPGALGTSMDVPLSPHQSKMSTLSQTMESSSIPVGRNYIQLDQPSDALAFIAYMTLQFRKIVCLVSSQRQELYAKLLESLTHANIHRVDTPQHYVGLSTKSEALRHTPNQVMLTPYHNFLSNWGWVRQFQPDFIIHWTQPAKLYHCTTGSAVGSLPHTIRVCVMVIAGEPFDAKSQEVERYPNTILNRYFHFNSTFQELREMSSRLLPGRAAVPPDPPVFKPPVPSNPQPPQCSESSQPSTPWASTIPSNPSNIATLPVGHYYIVTDQANEMDLIPIIALIAQNTNKVICHIPDSSSRYNNLIGTIADVTIMVSSSSKVNHFKAAASWLKGRKSGLVLKNIIPQWNSCWTKSLADAVIYCGAPPDLVYYLNECNLKVDYSYLILTRLQYSGLQSQIARNRRLQPHPLIRGTENAGPGSLLYDLRQRIAPHIR